MNISRRASVTSAGIRCEFLWLKNKEKIFQNLSNGYTTHQGRQKAAIQRTMSGHILGWPDPLSGHLGSNGNWNSELPILDNASFTIRAWYIYLHHERRRGVGVGERGFWMSGQKRVVSKQKQTPAVKLIQAMKLIIEKTISRLLYPGPISYLSRDNFFVDPTERFKSYYWQSTLHTLLYNTILVCEPEDPRQESCSLVTDAEHKSCLPVKR